MNVLSLFDGMSCGMISLERAGIEVDNYYASEINSKSIFISKKNYPKVIHLGDVQKIHYTKLGIEVDDANISSTRIIEVDIGLLLGGSPCQDLSNANKSGKGLDGDKSKLFYEYVRILKEIRLNNPDVLFLLENVKMKDFSRDIITKELGVNPIIIDSALVSGQSRKRYYWTNIPNVTIPDDLGICLIDILQDDIDDKYYHSPAAINYMDRTVKGGRNHWDFAHHSDTNKAKSSCITANFKKGVPYNVIIDRRKVNQLNPYSGCSTNQPKMQHRIFSSEGKSTTLTSFSRCLSIYPDKQGLIRRLTPIECERLQTLPDNYTEGVTDGHRYEMLGNGWTIDVIAHIFKGLK